MAKEPQPQSTNNTVQTLNLTPTPLHGVEIIEIAHLFSIHDIFREWYTTSGPGALLYFTKCI